jgi:hypothetical protein
MSKAQLDAPLGAVVFAVSERGADFLSSVIEERVAGDRLLFVIVPLYVTVYG